jgi:hypothetical protein
LAWLRFSSGSLKWTPEMLRCEGRRDYTLTSAIPGPSSGVHFTQVLVATHLTHLPLEAEQPRMLPKELVTKPRLCSSRPARPEVPRISTKWSLRHLRSGPSNRLTHVVKRADDHDRDHRHDKQQQEQQHTPQLDRSSGRRCNCFASPSVAAISLWATTPTLALPTRLTGPRLP